MNIRNYMPVALILALVPAAWPAAAQTEWTGIVSSSWTDDSNWNPAGVPTNLDPVVVDIGLPNHPYVNGASAEAAEIHIGLEATGLLQILNQGLLASGPAVLGGNADSVGSVIIEDAHSQWNIAGQLIVGGEGSGKLQIFDGASVASSLATRIAVEAGSEGAVYVIGPGSALSSASIVVGRAGPGSLEIAASGQVSSTSALVGFTDGGLGAVSVDGAGSEWNVATNIILGDQKGSGMLSISGNGLVVAGGHGILGNGGSASGEAILYGESIWAIGGELRVGRFGSGSLSISEGAAVVVAEAALVPAEQQQYSQGELTVNGRIIPAGGLFVNPQGRFSGSGVVTGSVTIAGGVLAPGDPLGTLIISDALELEAGALLEFELDGPGAPGDLLEVGGDLVLGGMLEVTDLGGMAPGVYVLIRYAGSLTDNGLALTGLPAGLNATVDTSVAGQVNLVVDILVDEIFADRFEP